MNETTTRSNYSKPQKYPKWSITKNQLDSAEGPVKKTCFNKSIGHAFYNVKILEVDPN